MVTMRRHLLQLFSVVLGCALLSTLTWWDHEGRPGDGGEHSGFVAVRRLEQDRGIGSLGRAEKGNETHAKKEGQAVEKVGLQLDDHEQDHDLAYMYGQKWERDCSEIVESKKDSVSYAQGKNCIQSCGNLFAVRQFDSRIARIQAAIQGAVGKLVFKIPYVPQCLTLIFYMCLVIAFVAFLPWIANSDYVGESVNSALGVVFFLSTPLAAVALAWCTAVLAVVVMGISEARAEDLGDVLESYPWAEAWVQPVAWMKNDYLPVLMIFYPPCIFGLVLFGIKASQWNTDDTDSFIGIASFVVMGCDGVVLATILVHGIYTFSEYLFLAGSHGVVWSCTKAYYAARLGWMPSTTPYWAGVAYVAASVVHGLLEKPREVTPGRTPDPRNKFMMIIPHPTLALGSLVVKMGTLLLDILLDMAQSIMFFCRGQPFFGAINLLGIGIQLVMMFLAAARGVASDVTLTAALLQSDAMSNFRSSWAAGMVLHEFYEKSFREAFGETYLSMSISIAAIFTMKFQYASDLQLILLSVFMSLHSIKSGVAEAREIVSAENEVALGAREVHFRIIPLNDYYARESYSKRSSVMTVSILRVSEAIVGVTTLAVCAASSSVKTTYLLAAGFSFIMCMPVYFWKYGSTICRTWMVAFNSIYEKLCEGDPIETIVYTIGLLTCLCAALLWTVLLAITPVLMMPMLLFWDSSITIPRAKAEDEEEDEASKISRRDSDEWVYTLMELANPGLIQAAFNKDFVLTYMSKAIFVSAFWVVLAVSHFAFQNPIFNFGLVWHEAIQAAHSDLRTTWWQGAIKLMLICSPGVALLFMCLAVCVLRLERVKWADELGRASEACEKEYFELRKAVEDACATLESKHIIKTPEFKGQLGMRKDSGGAALTSLICLKLMDSIFGAPDRLSLLKVWISPIEVQGLLDSLTSDEDKGWYLEQDVKTIFFDLKEGWTLRLGGDLMPAGRAKGMYGRAIGSHSDVPGLISQNQRRYAPESICLVFEGSAVSQMEEKMRERFDDTREDAPSASALAEHLQMLSDVLAADLSSPLLKSICGPQKEKLENIKECFQKLEEYCRTSLTLHTKFDKPDGTARAYQSLEDKEPQADENQASAQDLIQQLKEAVDAAPFLSEILRDSAENDGVKHARQGRAKEEEAAKEEDE